MTKPHYTHVYIKLRRVAPKLGRRGDRTPHNDATYEGKIIGRIGVGGTQHAKHSDSEGSASTCIRARERTPPSSGLR